MKDVTNTHTLIPFLVFTGLSLLSFATQADPRCQEWAAKLETAEGIVEWRDLPTSDWSLAPIGATFCYGDKIRVLEHRAALRLANDTLVRLKQQSVIHLLPPNNGFWLELLEGIAHFLSRTPQSFEVKAPYLNAAVEGTEFLVSAAATNAVSVFEGQVTVVNPQGTTQLTDGQQSTATAGQPPSAIKQIRLKDSAAWTLHYPPIFATDQASPHVRKLIIESRYREALTILQKLNEPTQLALAASLALTLGDQAQASQLLTRAQTIAPDSPDAAAVLAFISLVQNNALDASTQTQKLLQQYPENVNVLIADSFAQQGTGELARALKDLEKAYGLAGNSLPVMARYAELLLSSGNTEQANKIIQVALAMAPSHSRINSLAGFAALNLFDTGKARKYFQLAIQTDNNDALAHFGLALSWIQAGDLSHGREVMELAVLLDPSNSLYRSYLGKTYFEATHFNWAKTQYELAKQLDTNDPTPWFYEAQLLKRENRFPEALGAIYTAIEKNDNRAVYRSRMMLDSDAAARGANQSYLLKEMAFDRLAEQSAGRAIISNFDDFAPHQALAITAPSTPTFDSARIHHTLLAKMLQPIGVNNLSVGQGEPTLQLVPWISPSQLGTNEYSSLYSNKGLNGHVNFIAGTQESAGHEIQATLNSNNTSLTLGQYNIETKGYRDNNDLMEKITELDLHHQLTNKIKLFGHIVSRENRSGDTFNNPNSEFFNTTLSNEIDYKTNEFGLSFQATPNHIQLVHYSESDDNNATYYVDSRPGSAAIGIANNGVAKWKLAEFASIDQFKYVSSKAGYTEIQSNIENEFLFTLPALNNLPIGNSQSQYKTKITTPYLTLLSPQKLPLAVSAGIAHPKATYQYTETTEELSKTTFNTALHFHKGNRHALTLSRFSGISTGSPRFGSIKDASYPYTTLFPEHSINAINYTNQAYLLTSTDALSLVLSAYESKGKGSYIGPDFQLTEKVLFEEKNTDIEITYIVSNNMTLRLSQIFLAQTSTSPLQDNDSFADQLPEELKTNRTNLQVSLMLFNGLNLTLEGIYIDQKRTYQIHELQNTFEKERDSFKLTNAKLAFTPPRGNFHITLNLENLFNQPFNYFHATVFDPQNTYNVAPYSISPERSLSMQLGFKL